MEVSSPLDFVNARPHLQIPNPNGLFLEGRGFKSTLDYPYWDTHGRHIDEEYLNRLKSQSLDKWFNTTQKTKYSASSCFALELSKALFDEDERMQCLRDRDAAKRAWLKTITDVFFESTSEEERKIRWDKARMNVDHYKTKLPVELKRKRRVGAPNQA